MLAVGRNRKGPREHLPCTPLGPGFPSLPKCAVSQETLLKDAQEVLKSLLMAPTP
jgi:hypothetical protein